MKKLSFALLAILLLSGCRSVYCTFLGCDKLPPSKEEMEAFNKCQDEVLKKYANDSSEDVSSKISPAIKECMQSHGYWTWYREIITG